MIRTKNWEISIKNNLIYLCMQKCMQVWTPLFPSYKVRLHSTEKLVVTNEQRWITSQW
jgi:hypothetical protein